VADIEKLSKQMIDFAERLADVSDAAKGKGIRRRRSGTLWVLLPAAGAGVYALVTSGSVGRRTKNAAEQAKARASDLPDDLLNLLRQPSATGQSTSGGTGQSRSGNAKSGSGRRTRSTRRNSSARKSTSAR